MAKTKRKSKARVRSTRMFCRCPDCKRPMKRNEGDLYHCHKCPVGGSQSWSQAYLRAYWRGFAAGNRQNAELSEQPRENL